jgi:hypothetical protein
MYFGAKNCHYRINWRVVLCIVRKNEKVTRCIRSTRRLLHLLVFCVSCVLAQILVCLICYEMIIILYGFFRKIWRIIEKRSLDSNAINALFTIPEAFVTGKSTLNPNLVKLTLHSNQ